MNINFKSPETNQVMVKILYSAFYSSQYGEMIGIKEKINFASLLGHEACTSCN